MIIQVQKYPWTFSSIYLCVFLVSIVVAYQYIGWQQWGRQRRRNSAAFIGKYRFVYCYESFFTISCCHELVYWAVRFVSFVRANILSVHLNFFTYCANPSGCALTSLVNWNLFTCCAGWDSTLKKQNTIDRRKKSKIGEIGESLHTLIGTLSKKKGDKIKRALTDVTSADSENAVLAGAFFSLLNYAAYFRMLDLAGALFSYTGSAQSQ